MTTVVDALALTKLKAMPTVIATIVGGGGGDRIEWQVKPTWLQLPAHRHQS